MIPACNINIKPVIYLKNTDGDYIRDENGSKIIEKIGNEVSPLDIYEYKITITEDFYNILNDIEINTIVTPINNIEIKVINS